MDASLTEILSNVQPLVVFKLSPPFVAANYTNARSFPIFTLTLMIHRDRSLAAAVLRKLEKASAETTGRSPPEPAAILNSSQSARRAITAPFSSSLLKNRRN